MNTINNDYGCGIIRMSEYYVTASTELELWESEADRKSLQAILTAVCFPASATLVAFGLTASVATKQWPIECYDKLLRKLKARSPNLNFVLLGDSVAQGESIRDEGDVWNFCGKLTLRETVALLRNVDLYVGNDTGLMHMAAACGCAVVEISSFARNGDMACGTSSRRRFSPWSKEAIVVQPLKQMECCHGMCQMSYAHCIKQVTVEAVLEASCSLLADKV